VYDPGWLLVDRLERLTEPIHMLVAAELAGPHSLTEDQAALTGPHSLTEDQAALNAAQLRHEVRHALASWRPPRDSYRAEDVPR
jgi:hypothetical protein